MTTSSLDCRVADLCSPLSSLASCAVRRAPCEPALTPPLRRLPSDDARSPKAPRSSWLAALITLLGALHGKGAPAPTPGAPAAPAVSVPAAPAAGAPVDRAAPADPAALAAPVRREPVAACVCVEGAGVTGVSGPCEAW